MLTEEQLLSWGYRRVEDCPSFTEADGSGKDFFRKYYNAAPPPGAPNFVRILDSEASKQSKGSLI